MCTHSQSQILPFRLAYDLRCTMKDAINVQEDRFIIIIINNNQAMKKQQKKQLRKSEREKSEEK